MFLQTKGCNEVMAAANWPSLSRLLPICAKRTVRRLHHSNARCFGDKVLSPSVEKTKRQKPLFPSESLSQFLGVQSMFCPRYNFSEAETPVPADESLHQARSIVVHATQRSAPCAWRPVSQQPYAHSSRRGSNAESEGSASCPAGTSGR